MFGAFSQVRPTRFPLYRQEVMCLMLLEPWRTCHVGRWARGTYNPASVTKSSKASKMLLQQVGFGHRKLCILMVEASCTLYLPMLALKSISELQT